MGHVVGHAPDRYLRDGFITQQPVAQPFRQLAERPDVDVSVQPDLHHPALVHFQPHLGLLDVVGKGPNPVHSLVDVLEGLHPVGARDQLDDDAASSFPGLGGQFLDPLYAADGFFHRLQNPLLDLRRGRPRVADADANDVQLVLGVDLLLDVEGRPDPAADEDDHEQVRGDGIARHPLDGSGARRLFAGGVRGCVVHGAVAGGGCVPARWATSALTRRGAPSTTVARFDVTIQSLWRSPSVT